MAPSPANLDAFLAACETPIETFHAHPSHLVGEHCHLNELTAAYIGQDGKYVGGASQQTTRRVTGPTPGSGPTTWPWTQSLVISLRTLLTRGPGSNGRIYYPFTGGGIQGADGRVAQGTTLAFAVGAKAMLDGINSAAESNLPGTGGVSVMSQVSTGIAATVVGIRVGRRLDRQERRENDRPEDYQSQTLAAAALVATPSRSVPLG